MLHVDRIARCIFFILLQYSIVYYEKDGDEVFQHRLQPDVVTLPDYEILQVNIRFYEIKWIYITLLLILLRGQRV